MSVTSPTSSGSVEDRKDSAVQGLIPYARHTRATEAWLFSRSASSREDHCVTPSFFGWLQGLGHDRPVIQFATQH
jgi:hypothetical protein